MSQYYYVSLIPVKSGGYTVLMYDFPEIITHGDTIDEAVDLATDAFALCIEEYIKAGKPMPEPSTLDTTHDKIKMELSVYADNIDLDQPVVVQLLKTPNMDIVPVKVTISIRKHVLEQIDRKAESCGMTRSGLLAKAALTYTPE